MRVSSTIRVLVICLALGLLFATPSLADDETAAGWTAAAKGNLDLGTTGEQVVEGTLGLSEVACIDCQWDKTQTVTGKEVKKLEGADVNISLGTITAAKTSPSPGGALVLSGSTLVIPTWNLVFYGEKSTINTLMVPMTRTAMDPSGKVFDLVFSPEISLGAEPEPEATPRDSTLTGKVTPGAARTFNFTIAEPSDFGLNENSGLNFGGPLIKDKLWFFGSPGQEPLPENESIIPYLTPIDGLPCNDAVHGRDQINFKLRVKAPWDDEDFMDEDEEDGFMGEDPGGAFFNISPRISFTYDITGDGKSKISLADNNQFHLRMRPSLSFDHFNPPATGSYYGGMSQGFGRMLDNTRGLWDTPGGNSMGGWFGADSYRPLRLGDGASRMPSFWMLNLGLDGSLKQPREGEPECSGAAVLVESPDGMCPWQPGVVPWIDPFRQSYSGKKNVRLDDVVKDLRSRPGVIYVEVICYRIKQDTPDDEYYLNAEYMAAKEKAKKKKKKKSLLGFGLKLFKKAQEGTISIGGYDDDAGPEVMNQWSLTRIGYRPMNLNDIPSAWNTTTGQKNPVVVAVIDTGLDMTHPDFSLDNLWINKGEVPGNLIDDDGNGYVDDVLGWNFVDWNNAPFDDDGHGTLVSGIIAANTNNAKGIAGINWGAKIMPLKVSDSTGRTNAFDVAKAIMYAANNGARVINLSFGGGEISAIEQLAVDYANARGAIVVASSGNEGVNIENYSPASLRGVITVGGTGYDDSPVEDYNFGQNVFVAAPSERIFSLRARNTSSLGRGLVSIYSFGEDGLYYYAGGTSFSAPMVSGTVSLMLSMDPTLTLDEVRWKLLQGAVSKAKKGGWDPHAGFGRIDAVSALEADPAQGMVLAWLERPEIFGERVLFFGSASAAKFKAYTLEIGRGSNPSSWTTVKESEGPTSSGVLGMASAASILKSRDWSLRLRVTTQDDKRSEATYQFNSRDLKR